MTSSPVELAQQMIDEYSIEETAYVTYQSVGRLLVIGTTRDVLGVLPLLSPFSVSVLGVGNSTNQEQNEILERVNFVGIADSIQLSGYLGNFTVDGIPSSYDLVLDLCQRAVHQSVVTPIGYFRLSLIAELPQLVEQLSELVGVFDKPKFFSFSKNKCAHSQNNIEGCRQCLDICAADAITSVDFQIVVNPYLCQGCGECSVVCPSGAMNYQYPSRQNLLCQLQEMLTAFYSAGGIQPIVVFCSIEERCLLPSNPKYFLLFPLESLSSVGAEICLVALALGVTQVVFYNSESLLPDSELALNNELAIATAIITSMGFSEQMLQRSEGVLKFNTNLRAIPPATFVIDNDKRVVFRMAVDYLLNYASQQPRQVKLGSHSAWGEVKVEKDLCTLCFSCVSACPSGALQSGQSQPQLKFIESLCLQCDLCVSTCPEQAIELRPRYLYDSVEARRARCLHEEPAFHCINCQKPFATKKMVLIIKEKLLEHPMYQGKALKRLEMCEECRIKSQLG